MVSRAAPLGMRSLWKMRCLPGERLESVTVAPVNAVGNAAGDVYAVAPVSGNITRNEDRNGSHNVSLKQSINGPRNANVLDETNPNIYEELECVDAEIIQSQFTQSEIELSGEQKAVLHLVMQHKSLFFTGAAGTGKSVLLRQIVTALRRELGHNAIAVTAMTGIAACNIGGQTLHRFAGVGLAKDPVNELERRIRKNQTTLNRWLNTKVLLIDEVSMLQCEFLEKLDGIARGVRGSNEPFGGIQLVCTGDLFQLPPVMQFNVNKLPPLCFESEVWKQCISRTVFLTEVFRQADPRFANLLNELRVGHVSPEAEKTFRELNRVPHLPKGIVPTRLFPTRAKVTQANTASLERLDQTEYVYTCHDSKSDSTEAKYLEIDKHVNADPEIKLKVGAQVMLIKNIDDTLVNGSVGRVVAFVSADKLMYKDYGAASKYAGGEDDSETSAKSVGASHFRSKQLEGEEKERIERLLGCYGTGPGAERKRRLAEAMSQPEAEKHAVLPVVRFVMRDKSMRLVIVRPEVWEITNSDNEIIASRTQVPLILAWALSIHKAQGQTLPYVSVSLDHIFEKGQAYVAISRATSMEGLQILNFHPHKVRADSRVIEYYKGLERLSQADIDAAEVYCEQVRLQLKRQQELKKLKVKGMEEFERQIQSERIQEKREVAQQLVTKELDNMAQVQKKNPDPVRKRSYTEELEKLRRLTQQSTTQTQSTEGDSRPNHYVKDSFVDSDEDMFIDGAYEDEHYVRLSHDPKTPENPRRRRARAHFSPISTQELEALHSFKRVK